MSEFNVTIKPADNATIVTLSGEADVDHVQTLDQQLMVLSAQRPKYVIIDLAHLRFISSICMGSLIRFHHGLTHVGGSVSLACAQPPVLEALQRARLDKVLPLHETVEIAMHQAAGVTPSITAGDPAS